ncbi:hypothetical protein HYW83_01125 [Candidatus Peregrinibacteria bacterium]|nr:hypothetical protein [Candidatus Peregrinibacteria bacterium]
MFKIFRREKTKRPQLFLALDIGTEFVKALVCESEGNIALVRGVGKKRQKLGDMQSGAVMDIASVIQNCSEAIEQATRQADGYPTEVIMGIAGELVKGMTSRTAYVRKEPDTKIDLSELKNIIHKVQWKSFEETRSQLAYETLRRSCISARSKPLLRNSNSISSRSRRNRMLWRDALKARKQAN